ncbi:MAG TPA: serine hydrolase domain-containing protein, partial [Steroidobacteraceae bacterium]
MESLNHNESKAPARAITDGALARWERTDAVDQVIDETVDSGRIVGTVVMAARHGEVIYQHAAGYADRETKRPMRENEVFRLASMTKAIVAVAALALVDHGQLGLDDPVTRSLPSFRPKLADGREPLITIRHLLTHTAGLNYGFLESADGPYHRLAVSDGLDNSGISLEENLRRIAAAPLLFEPGSNWHYSIAIDVLGAVLEKVTGSTLPQLIRNIVTGPLNLSSLKFLAPAAASLATPYGDGAVQPIAMSEFFKLSFFGNDIQYSPGRVLDPRAFPSGGTGMVGTAHDYLRFIEAIRTGGAGVVRPETAATMTSNSIGSIASAPGYGFGLGVQVLKDPAQAQSPLNPGAWNWGGVYGTHFWVDP